MERVIRIPHKCHNFLSICYKMGMVQYYAIISIAKQVWNDQIRQFYLLQLKNVLYLKTDSATYVSTARWNLQICRFFVIILLLTFCQNLANIALHTCQIFLKSTNFSFQSDASATSAASDGDAALLTLCRSARCRPGRECRVLASGAAECVCRDTCNGKNRRSRRGRRRRRKVVCGSDGLAYESHCELHREACLTGQLQYLEAKEKLDRMFQHLCHLYRMPQKVLVYVLFGPCPL